MAKRPWFGLMNKKIYKLLDKKISKQTSLSHYYSLIKFNQKKNDKEFWQNTISYDMDKISKEEEDFEAQLDANRIIQKAFKHLSEFQIKILNLYYWKELSVIEIAEITNQKKYLVLSELKSYKKLLAEIISGCHA